MQTSDADAHHVSSLVLKTVDIGFQKYNHGYNSARLYIDWLCQATTVAAIRENDRHDQRLMFGLDPSKQHVVLHPNMSFGEAYIPHTAQSLCELEVLSSIEDGDLPSNLATDTTSADPDPQEGGVSYCVLTFEMDGYVETV